MNSTEKISNFFISSGSYFNKIIISNFFTMYNKNIKKGPLINQYIDIYRKNRFNINASVSKRNHFGTVGESYGVSLVPKYKQNKIGLAFGEYANKMKKIRCKQIN